MRRIAEIVEDGKLVGLVHGADAFNQEITVSGNAWRFDFDDWCGPLWLKKDGRPRKCQYPTNKAVWDAFDEWYRHYKES